VNTRIRGVGLIIQDNKILLMKHHDARGNDYFSPPGGGVEDDESLYDCVEREVMEETGRRVKARKLVAVRQFRQSQIERNSIELYFGCDLLGDDGNPDMTDSELVALDTAQFISLDKLENMHIHPEQMKDKSWLKKILSSEEGAFFVGDEELAHEISPKEYSIPPTLRNKYPEYFKNSPDKLDLEGSFSANPPLLMKNDHGGKMVLRRFDADTASKLLRFTNILRDCCNDLLGRPLYAQYIGCTHDRPFIDLADNSGWLLQEFSNEHRLDILSDLRDLDVYSLGKTCGRIQKILDSAPKELVPSPAQDHPLAMTLEDRLAIIESRLDTALLEMPVKYAEWLCSETAETIDRLAHLGATEYRTTAIDRDLNVRNSSVTFQDSGLATLYCIFDPDFCLGTPSDSLRNPSLSFASKTPRLTLDEILKEDFNTIGGPRWMLFLKGYLETYPLSREEINAIPYLEKLEILTFRLFENSPRYAVPLEYKLKFRKYTESIISRINNINWEQRLNCFLPKYYSFAFPDMLSKPDKPWQRIMRRELPPVSPQTMLAFESIRHNLPQLLEKVESKIVINIGIDWKVIVESNIDEKGSVIVGEGYPFLMTSTKIAKENTFPWNNYKLTFHFIGKLLQDSFREKMLKLLHSRFPDHEINYNPATSEQIRMVTLPLADSLRSKIFLYDPFQYKGDALYIGIYYSMVRKLNPACDITVLTRNEGIWKLFDCTIAKDLSELPNDILAGIIPIPIDNQWEEAMRILPAILHRTRLVLIPQRNIVIKRDQRHRRIDIFHTEENDHNLEFTNISTYTWSGLHCLLPKPVGLNSSLALFKKPLSASIFIEERPFFINPSSSLRLKDIPPKLCLEIVKSLRSTFGENIKILINGGDPKLAEEQEFAGKIRELLGDTDDIEVWHGSDMTETAAMLSSVRMVITADTSISHTAAFKGVPTIVIWNKMRWDELSPLDMVHNGPVGFASVFPNTIDLIICKNQDDYFPALADDVKRIDRGIRLVKTLYYEGQDGLFVKPPSSYRLVYETQQAVERAHSKFLDITPNLENALCSIADEADSLLSQLKAEWRDWLQDMDRPLNIKWVIEQLRYPNKTGWNEKLKQQLYALDLWRISPLMKIAAFCYKQKR
jgi:8-oxo-dGTP diphosphatase